MITPESRYSEGATQFVDSHEYDIVGAVSKNEENKVIVNRHDTIYRITTQPDTPPPHLYMAKATDTYPLLAYRILQDPNRWWMIASANPDQRYPLDLAMGDLIRLPQ